MQKNSYGNAKNSYENAKNSYGNAKNLYSNMRIPVFKRDTKQKDHNTENSKVKFDKKLH